MFFRSFTDSWTITFFGLALVTISWESLEIATAKIPAWNSWFKKKFHMQNLVYSWPDGAFDVVCNYTGAILLLYLFK